MNQRRDHARPLMERFAKIEPAAGTAKRQDGQDLTVPLALASEYPVQRWFGTEILSMDANAVRLDRMNDGAAVLFNHDPDAVRGSHIPGSLAIGADRVLRGMVRLTAATADGRDAVALVEGGHLTKVSVGYRIHDVTEKTKRGSRRIPGDVFERALSTSIVEAGGKDALHFRSTLDKVAGPFERDAGDEVTYIVTDWEPYETSLTTVPADPTVGVGRSTGFDATRTTGGANQAANAATKGQNMDANTTAAAAANADPNKAATQHAQDGTVPERLRIQTLTRLAAQHKIDDKTRDDWIDKGETVDGASQKVLDILAERGRTNPQSVARLDLSQQETKRYSLFRAVLAAHDKDWSKAGFEAECSRTIAQRLGIVPDNSKFYVPLDIQRRPIVMGEAKRDLTVGTGSAGGYLVETENVGFIDMLRNRSILFRMGATRLSGLVGNVMVPRQSAAATAYWLANEATAITETNQVFQQMALAPKNVGAYTEVSRQLALQSSPDAEGIIMADLAAVVALAVDLAGINGSGGGGQPQGVIGTTGVGAVTGTAIAWAGIIQFETDVLAANAMVNPATFGYVTTPAVMGLLKARQRFTSTDSPLWVQGPNPGDGRVNGYNAMATSQMPSANMLAGDWSQVVVAEWGVLEVGINPYANFQAGIIGVRAIYSVDVGVRHGPSFDLATAIT